MFKFSNDIALLHETGVYRQIGAAADKRCPLKDSAGNTMGPWNATPKRRKIARAMIGEVALTHSIWRDVNSWTVWEETVFHSPDFRAIYTEERSWAFDPAQPFPYARFDDARACGGSIWNELDGESDGLAIDYGLAHFLNWISVDRDSAGPLIDQAEEDGSIDTQDATMARLVLA